MPGTPVTTAARFVPPTRDLAKLRAAAAGCRGCDLWRRATQTVFGEGPRRADLLLVGEQPGDVEDRAGHPFVGPAGRLLDESLVAAGIDRRRVWLTNAVKHFKWEAHGKRRMATVHPAAILRAPDGETRRRETARFVEDLRAARDVARREPPTARPSRSA